MGILGKEQPFLQFLQEQKTHDAINNVGGWTQDTLA